MIPHHAGAMLMCEEAPLRDPQIKELCAAIVASQRSEIEHVTSSVGWLGQSLMERLRATTNGSR